jgi:hypothetical protein
VIHERTPADAVAEYSLNDAVSLLSGQNDVPTGAVGRVLGTFPHPGGPSYAVVFVAHKLSALALRPEEIVLANDHRAENLPMQYQSGPQQTAPRRDSRATTNGPAYRPPSINRVAAPAMPVSSTAAERAEMDSQFNAPDQEAERTPPKSRFVFHDEDLRQKCEDREILARWVAAQQISGVEARILELRLISQDTRTEDLRGAIDGAIEDCDLHRAKLAEFLAATVAA